MSTFAPSLSGGIMINEKPSYLDSLEKDLAIFKESIMEASNTIMKEGVSDYPVFIAAKEPFPIGELILDKDELQTTWSVFASTAEDLIKAGIIQVDKARFFITQYKPAKEYICLFVYASENEAGFIFVPY
jgi:hypothetical protein